MATITEDVLRKELRGILPGMDPTSVTVLILREKLASRLGVSGAELKDQWGKTIKKLIPEVMQVMRDDSDKENEAASESEEEEVKRPRKGISTIKKRGRNAIQDSDESEESEGSDESDNDRGSEESGDSDNEVPARKRQRAAPKAKPKATPKPKPAASKPVKGSVGFESLKELARVAGLLAPNVYKLLKGAKNEQEQEQILRDRLDNAGVRFSGTYPSRHDIAEAKKKREKAQELDGIDTSLIIDAPRSRRATPLRPDIRYGNDRDEEEDDEPAPMTDRLQDESEEKESSEAEFDGESSDEEF
ncbi:hypothetical protein Poli38472_000735 [Pythium oligandrum]|uniref:Histone chaperone domain-containing protein n=1 Tax=Pythium oligandrum TaxID=41045 RepID=A0A8K1CCW6_PYTOL|nr:hypothetical protein Poli38472_000735 [Pythium oligandrum]|eukprot:TMW60693.1 hypothetical protein Poli38472_000735 [Pythium oligandrum]